MRNDRRFEVRVMAHLEHQIQGGFHEGSVLSEVIAAILWNQPRIGRRRYRRSLAMEQLQSRRLTDSQHHQHEASMLVKCLRNSRRRISERVI